MCLGFEGFSSDWVALNTASSSLPLGTADLDTVFSALSALEEAAFVKDMPMCSDFFCV
jgi:hypothetical protein